MKLRNIKIYVSFLLAIVMAFSATVTCFADTATEPSYAGPYFGRTYKVYAELKCNGYRAYAKTSVIQTNGNDTPGGYIGAGAYLYNDNNILREVEKGYSNDQQGYFTIETDSWDKKDNYRCFGAGFFKTSNTNTHEDRIETHWTAFGTVYNNYTSPMQHDNIDSLYSAQIDNNSSCIVTVDGKTYGTIVDRDTDNDLPDMIKAEGVNGNIGYIEQSAIVPDLSNTDSMQEVIDSGATGEYVPLYDIDGNVIDTFFVGIQC